MYGSKLYKLTVHPYWKHTNVCHWSSDNGTMCQKKNPIEAQTKASPF